MKEKVNHKSNNFQNKLSTLTSYNLTKVKARNKTFSLSFRGQRAPYIG